MNRLTTAIASVFIGLAGAALAQEQDNPVLVELFTSQGCASCPAADAVLAELGPRDDVIPLALHVDYWDYIGWTDDFGDASFTKRQKGYARVSGRRSIYTPQMVIDGRYDVVGSRTMKVMDAIRHVAKTKPVRAAITLSRSGPTLLIRAEPRETGLPEMTVHMVRYDPEERVEIGAGENEGRAITYTHIAHDWQVLGDWNGQAPLDMAVPIEGDDPVVVVLQEPHYGPVVAAARLR